MKCSALLAALVAITATSAVAQTSSVNQAVSNTIYKSLKHHYPSQDAAWYDNAWTAIKNANATLYNSTCGAGKSIACLMIYLDVPKPLQLGYGDRHNGGGSFGGGGATGSWNDSGRSCADHVWSFDVQGNLIVPTHRLQGGNALIAYSTTTSFTTPVFQTGLHDGSANVSTDSRAATALWYWHKRNEARDTRGWFGIYHINSAGTQFTASTVAYYNGTSLVSREVAARSPTQASFISAPDCPQQGSAGGDFDFYKYGSGMCINYAPNYALSASGYAVNDVATISAAEALNYPNGMNDSTLACPLNPAVIKHIAQKLWDRADVQPGVPDSKEICSDCVVTGGEDPQIDDLKDQPAQPDPEDNAPPATPMPTPTPTSTPSSGPDYSHDPVSPNEPEAPEIDWWPDLPTVSLNLGTPACPTYDLSVPGYGWTLTLESHCPLIEQNRAVIGAIMLLLFGVGSILIVLRA